MSGSGQVGGNVILRPVRMGLVFKPTLESLLRAVQSVTPIWGGIYSPVLSPGDVDESLTQARRLGVDALWPVDDHFESRNLCNTEGYRWSGLGDPFDCREGTLETGLVSAAWLLDESPSLRLVNPNWSPNDPIQALLSLWFGSYGNFGHGQSMAELFKERAESVTIGETGSIPDVVGLVSPIAMTSLEIDYRGMNGSCGVMVVDPQNPRDLARFWNLRAMGCLVFPWPRGCESRIEMACDGWLGDALKIGRVRTWHSGTGTTLGPTLEIWLGEDQLGVPVELVTLLARHDIGSHVGTFHEPMGWTGHHPFSTDFSRTFVSPVDPNEHSFSVLLPSFWPSIRRRTLGGGILTAQVSDPYEANTGPGWTANIPNLRDLSSLLDRYWNVGEPFRYLTHDGFAVAVSSSYDSVRVGLVHSFSIFEKLFAGSDWKCSQSDAGRFATQLIELLGGAGSDAANQPAVRAVIRKAARSRHGIPLQGLVQEAATNRGNWPSPLRGGDPTTYPARVVNFLLHRRILQPVLPVKCPSCATQSALKPDDLATEVRCPMCSESYALGFAFAAANKRPEWRYTLTANVPDERLAESLPIMSAVNVLSSFGSFTSRAAPHVLGLQLHKPDMSCEIDVALAMNEGGPAVIVVGEVKSYSGEIDVNDLRNLREVQQYVLGKKVNCYVLAATLRERLSSKERADLRSFCIGSDSTLGGYSLQPLLPIVLTGTDLSVPRYGEDHPARWTDRGWGVASIAIESCKRNLGLAGFKYQPGGEDERVWQFQWDD